MPHSPIKIHIYSGLIQEDFLHYISAITAFIQPHATITVNNQIKTWSSDFNPPQSFRLR